MSDELAPRPRRARSGGPRVGVVAAVMAGWLAAALALAAPAKNSPAPQAAPTREVPASPAGAVAAPPFSEEAWRDSLPVHEAILAHPFLRGLQDGRLEHGRFAFYLVQDARYLRDFAEVLRVAADKAPRPEWAELLRRHARESVAEEERLQRSLLERHGLGPEQRAAIEPTPEAFAYANFLLATAHRASFGETLAALLPCYWIYGEVGRALRAPPSPDPLYREWIEAYASDGYDVAVQELRAIVDAVAARSTPEERERMLARYRIGARYEWMFWDAAYHRRGWPPAVR